jgi:precorrin-6A/cobalt-precorrin-6A reductase
LARYLAAERIAALIDATHPFAVEISRNAVEAARATATPLLTILRPQWEPAPGDCWLPVPDMPAAAAALGNAPRRVLLTIGRQDLAPFAAAPWHHYIVRSVDPPPPEELPPAAEIIAMRGPFLAADERRLLAGRGIQILVTKNSGGSATVGKLHAARALGIPVVMVARPPKPASETRATVVEALAWLARRHAASLPRGA